MITKPGKGIRNRGNNYERQIAKEFRGLGWEECVTSRSESKRLDDAGVDLCYTAPFSIQLKCTNNFKNPVPVLNAMPRDMNYNVVMNKIVGKGEFVTVDKSTFYELITMLKENKII